MTLFNKFPSVQLHILTTINCHFRAQMLMKIRLKGAQTGHSLLKKKADALQMRFRMILSKIIEVIKLMIPHKIRNPKIAFRPKP